MSMEDDGKAKAWEAFCSGILFDPDEAIKSLKEPSNIKDFTDFVKMIGKDKDNASTYAQITRNVLEIKKVHDTFDALSNKILLSSSAEEYDTIILLINKILKLNESLFNETLKKNTEKVYGSLRYLFSLLKQFRMLNDNSFENILTKRNILKNIIKIKSDVDVNLAFPENLTIIINQEIEMYSDPIVDTVKEWINEKKYSNKEIAKKLYDQTNQFLSEKRPTVLLIILQKIFKDLKEADDRAARDAEFAAEEKARAAARKDKKEAARKVAEEEAARKVAEEEAARKVAEEEAARKVAEEEAARKVAEEEAARVVAEAALAADRAILTESEDIDMTPKEIQKAQQHIDAVMKTDMLDVDASQRVFAEFREHYKPSWNTNFESENLLEEISIIQVLYDDFQEDLASAKDIYSKYNAFKEIFYGLHEQQKIHVDVFNLQLLISSKLEIIQEKLENLYKICVSKPDTTVLFQEDDIPPIFRDDHFFVKLIGLPFIKPN